MATGIQVYLLDQHEHRQKKQLKIAVRAMT